ncbi:MAG: molecular chaperone, partial [Neisseriaceae bacterium]|nr:molecular chaperone [Neisseriaceae bacterium]
LLGLLLLILAAVPSVASVVITGTRVVYPGQKNEVGIELKNDADQPALVQSWVDYFDASKNQANLAVPFVVMPPVFRMEANEGQSVRLMYTKEPLPLDRESLFRFNVLEIPPAPEAGTDNYLLMAIRHQLKLFYRPDQIKQKPEQVEQAYVWRLQPTASGQYALVVDNPTPFYLNLSEVTLQAGNDAAWAYEADMVAPKTTGHVVLPLVAAAQAQQVRSLKFVYINDYGGRVTVTAPVAH